MSNAFGIQQKITMMTKDVSDVSFNIQLPHLDLILTCEKVTDRSEGDFVLVIRTQSGSQLKILPATANSVGVVSVDNPTDHA
jgi:hypothetical protein